MLKSRKYVQLSVLLIALACLTGCTSSESGQNSSDSENSETITPSPTFEVSQACLNVMRDSSLDGSENGELLLKKAGDVCASREEWEAALTQYPAAIGIVSAEYLDGNEFEIFCHSYPKVRVCN